MLLTDAIFETGASGVPSNSQKLFNCGASLLGDIRVIVCPTPPQMNDFCDLLGTPDAPVSKIASVNKAENH